MAEKTLNTRIKLKYDTYKNWTTNNPKLLAGELAITEIPIETNAIPQEPAIMLKVGNGSDNFNTLPWVSATAADVYSWAKAAQKPEYNASEIKNLDSYIGEKIKDTNTKYKLVKVGDTGFSYKLQAKDLNGAWADAPESIQIDIPQFDPAEINNAIEANTTKIDNHITDKKNPHGVTKAQVGLANVDDKSVATIKSEFTGSVASGNTGFATGGAVHTAVEGAKTASKVTMAESTPEGWAKSYTFTQNGTTIGTINLPKELVVQSGTVEEVKVINQPYEGAKVGDKYIDLVIQNQSKHIYIPAKDLVDIYTAKEGATQVQVAISNTNEISAAIVAGSVSETELSSGVKTKLGNIATNTSEITKIKNGTTVVGKATSDASGNVITTTYATKEELKTTEGKASTAVQSATFAGKAMTKSGTALSITQGDARTALGLGTAAYEAKGAFATSAQGEKADSAVQQISTTANGGLKVTGKDKIDIDTAVTFVLDCGSSSKTI